MHVSYTFIIDVTEFGSGINMFHPNLNHNMLCLYQEDEDDDYIKVDVNVPMEVDNNISSTQNESLQQTTSTLRFHAHGKGGE